jgi:hypothetical protein
MQIYQMMDIPYIGCEEVSGDGNCTAATEEEPMASAPASGSYVR